MSPAQLSFRRRLVAVASLAAIAAAAPALGYVGPGAGFALVSGFLVVFTTIVLAFLSLLVWPFRMLWRLLRRRGRAPAQIRRFIVVGLDGQDPRITDRLMAAGKLPNFKRLAEMGCYSRLRTVFPSLSPVAWSSFSTGTNPGMHNIFDFVERDKKSYLPKQASTEIGKLERTLKIGRWRIPLAQPTIRLLRKSKPFWTILGENDIWSTVLRVPITFPPDRFYGAQLSAMMVPDLLGTLGTFLHYTTRPGAATSEGGLRFPLARAEAGAKVGAGHALYRGVLAGPPNSFVEGEPALELPLLIDVDSGTGRARVTIGKESIDLAPRQLSDWVTVTWNVVPGIKVQGLTRLMITEMGEHVSLYLSPINLDGESPAMPISHPSYYSTYLAKKIGKYSTLGLAEDTNALNDGVTDDGTFLRQTYDIDRERQDMFFAAFDRLRRGSLVCVFDATDRIQHMFWRYTEKGHPADRSPTDAPHRAAIEDLYIHNDALVGKVLDRIRPGDVLCVISDHGFTSFRRCVNLNRWLLDNGYLALKPGTTGRSDLLRDVDWSRTRAYCLGLAGMFINVKGREAQGIVAPGEEMQKLKAELMAKLKGLQDGAKGVVGVTELFDTAVIYNGPYIENAPDFIIGFNEGYRTSWDCANGIVAGEVFDDNVKAWSGDHGIDPRLVPGIFLCNRKIDAADPSILDLAPTVLTLFGIRPPKHMEGKPLFGEAEASPQKKVA
jgi:predicted AlkP superfamily phosphohydrolase/phosphomutase